MSQASDISKQDTLDVFIAQVTTVVVDFVEAHEDMTEADAMGALAVMIGGWVALKHRHFFPNERQQTVRYYQEVLRKAVEHAWEQCHSGSTKRGQR